MSLKTINYCDKCKKEIGANKESKYIQIGFLWDCKFVDLCQECYDEVFYFLKEDN